MRELVCKGFYLVDVVEDVIAFVHLDGEEFAPYEQDIGQTFGFVDDFHVFVGFLHILMCANSLSTKLVAIMAKAFLHLLS